MGEMAGVAPVAISIAHLNLEVFGVDDDVAVATSGNALEPVSNLCLKHWSDVAVYSLLGRLEELRCPIECCFERLEMLKF